MKALLIFLALLLTSPVPVHADGNITIHRFQVSAPDASGWYPAISTFGSFQVSLPLPFNDFTTHAQDPNVGPIDMHTVGCKSSDGYAYSVNEMPISGKMKNPNLDEIAELIKSNKGNKVTGIDESTYAGFATISFEVIGPNSSAFMRYIRTKNSLLSLTLEYPKGSRDLAERMMQRFFASLQWKSPAAIK